jgi:5-methylthioadenosine/S-adenosylhomocysteine deaminase
MSVTPATQAIHARWVIPVEPHGVVLDHHTLVIEHARIAAILPTAQWRSPGAHVLEIDCREHALMPGFVNAHTHAAMSLFRGMADDRPLMEWLERHIWPAEARHVSREFVRDGTRLAIAEMLLAGTTTLSDMYFFADEAAAAAVECGMRAVIGMIVIGFPSAWASDVDDYFRKGQAVHDQFRAHPLITTAFAPHAPYTVDDAALTRVAVLAEELDVPVHMHVQETRGEVENSLATFGMRPLSRLHRLGLVSPRLLAVHATCVEPDEIALIARSGVTIVHCPESNLKLASGLCPVAELLAQGVNVALGTDGAASNNDLDMLSELRTAALLAKGVTGDPCVLPAASALRLATLNGAHALGLDHLTGSLTVGKQADVIAIDLGQLRARPVYDPISQIVYSASRDQVREVWVDGRHVVRAGTLATVDIDGLTRDLDAWSARLNAACARGRSD